MSDPTSDDIDRMIADLEAAGWKPLKGEWTAPRPWPNFWRAPNGALFLGPAGAWRRMTGRASVTPQAEGEKGRR